MSENRKVTRRAGIVGFFTLISRVSGLLRDAVVAYFFGATLQADAFYMAFTIPNLLRRFVAEGALTVSFVPVFSESLRESPKGAKVLAHQAFSWLIPFLCLLTLAGIALAPWLVQWMAAGFRDDPLKFELTIRLTRWCFPYILFVSVAALIMGILNTLKKFAAPAMAPIFLNIGLIGGAIISPLFDPPIMGMVAGVLVGGLMQAGVQIPHLVRSGFFPRPNFGRHPQLKTLLGLMLPSAYGAAVYQVNVIILRYFASWLSEGSVSHLWYADRIFEFPMGVFAIAMATAILPTLSDFAAEKNWGRFRETFQFGLKMNFLITLPAMVGLIVLARPIVQLLLERGAFDPQSTLETSRCLVAFALGLPFLGMARITVPAYYAMKDAKRPVYFATLAVAVNLAAAWFLSKQMGAVGLALALTISSVVNALGLLLWLRFRIGPLGAGSLWRLIAQGLAASGVMGLVLWLLQTRAGWLATDLSFGWRALQLFLAMGMGVLLYFGVARLLGCHEVKRAIRLVRERR